MDEALLRLERRAARERSARKEAERLLEERSLELYQANQKLEVELARSRRYLDTAQTLMVALDLEGRIAMINRPGCELLGYAQEELLGENWFEKCMPAGAMTRGRFPAYLRVLTRGRAVARHYENRVLCRDGSERLVAWHSALLSDKLGRVTGVLSSGEDITSRKAAELALRQSEERFRIMTGAARNAVMMLDGLGRITFWNRAAQEMFGYREADALGRDFCRLVAPPESLAVYQQVILGSMKASGGSASRALELHALRRDGAKISIDLSISAVRRGDEWQAIGIARDITEQRRAANVLLRVNRHLRLLSACNKAMMRSADEMSLLREICRLVVDEGNYRMAWIGFAMEDERRSVRPMASAGDSTAYLEEVRVSWGDEPSGSGPTGTAIREHRPVINRDAIHNDAFQPWQEAARKHRFLATIALPVLVDDGSTGALNIYAGETEAFDADEVRLLTELTGNLAYGIRVHRDRLARQQAEEAVRQSEMNYRLLARNSADFIFWTAPDGAFRYVSPACRQVTGHGADEFLADPKLMVSLIHPDDRAAYCAHMEGLGQGEAEELEFRLVRADGSLRWIVHRCRAVIGEDGAYLGRSGTNRDITERKRAEESAHKASLYARSLIEANLDAMVVINPEGRITDVNRATEEMTGIARDDLVGQDFRINATDPEAAYRGFRQVFDEGRVTGYPLTIRHASGRTTDVMLNGSLYRDERGRVEGLVAAARDVSELKRTQGILALQARRAEALLELPRVAETLEEIPLMQRGQELAEDLTGSRIAFIHFVNEDEQSVELVAWSRRTLEHYCQAGYDKHYPLAMAGIWADALRQRRPVVCNDYPAHPGRKGLPEGHAHLHRFVSVPVIENGKVVMLTGVGNKPDDYTDMDVESVQLISNEIWRIVQRRRSEQFQRKLFLAVEQSPESVIITNPDSRIEYVNEAFVRKSGFSRQEVLGQSPAILRSGETPRETYDSLKAAMASGQVWKGEFLNRRQDGSEYTDFAIVAPLRQPDGSISHYVSVQEDITEKKRIGKELDQYRHHLERLVAERTAEANEARIQAEAANQAKSAFLANMSHEIRTPMNAVLGLTYLLRQESPRPDQLERLEQIATSANHLLGLINDILDLSKIEAGRLLLERGDFRISAVLEQVRVLMDGVARAKGLSLVVEPVPAGDWVSGDAMRLRQALLNYVSNAVKFTERGTVRVRASVLSEMGDGLEFLFEVEDTGIGISEEGQRRLFNAFEQADGSITRKFGGTGLGLAITRRLTELMGGTVGARSEVGRGSTFWLSAQFMKGSGAPPAVQEGTGSGAAGPVSQRLGARLLLAEDHPINRQVATDLLKAVGLEVETAENGLVALEKARAGLFDLVLMDVQMPEMDGLTAARAIRALAGWEQVPILAMTAETFEDTRAACVAAGMNDFVAKPVAPDDLYATIRRWLPAESLHGLRSGGAAGAADKRLAPVADLPGLDVGRGLLVMGGDAGKYMDLLRQFAGEHADDMQRMAHFLSVGDRKAALGMAHALKGVAGTLGYTAVSVAAQDMESQLRALAGDDLSDVHVSMGRIAWAIGALGQRLAGQAAVSDRLPAEEVDMGKARADLAELAGYLEHNDTRAMSLCQEAAPGLRALLGDAFEPLLARVTGFDFEAAMDILKKKERA